MGSQKICLAANCLISPYYFEAVLLNVTVTGNYRIFTQSNIDTVGSIYNQTFDARYLGLNLIYSDDDSHGDRQYQIDVKLQAGNTYVLMTTTFASNVTGAFSIIINGPGPIIFRKINVTSMCSYLALVSSHLRIDIF